MIVGVYYEPHAGKSTATRLAFYKQLHQAWQTLCRSHPSAAKILAGDTNLPDLQFDDQGNISPMSQVEQYWCSHFLPNMKCANLQQGAPAPTHRKGNTLDLILYSDDLPLLSFAVGDLAGSDHFPAFATFGWGAEEEPNDEIWKPAKNISQQQFDDDMRAPMASLHKWIHPKIAAAASHHDMAKLVDQYTVLLGALVQGVMWRRQSPYGRFSRPQPANFATPWWNTQCRSALTKMRSKRGTPELKKARLHLRQTIAKAKRDHWRALVIKSEKTTKWSVQLKPSLHKKIKSTIKAKHKSTQIVRVDREILPKGEAISTWTGYLAAQVSWQGPESPSAVLARLRGGSAQNTPNHSEFDDAAHLRAAREVREWEKTATRKPRREVVKQCFSFVEYCDAQSTLNAAAHTSPLDGLPMLLPLSTDEAIRTTVLGLINLRYVARRLPQLWWLLPILPIKKPNKGAADIAGHRPISLFAALLKVFDKLLFHRLWPAIAAAVAPWQGEASWEQMQWRGWSIGFSRPGALHTAATAQSQAS